jgi:hypothetical protein
MLSLTRAVTVPLFICASALAISTFAQGRDTIDKPRYYPEYVTHGEETLSKFTVDIPALRIMRNEGPSDFPAMRLPAMTPGPGFHALGVYQGRGYLTAVFDTPSEKSDAPGVFLHHIQVWGTGRPQGTTLLHDVSISGGPGSKVRFFEPSPQPMTNGRTRTVVSDAPTRPPAVIISISNTTDYDDVYWLGQVGQPAAKMLSAWDFDIVDLANDGNYEIVAWQRMTYDLNCNFLVESEHSYPEVYGRRPNGGAYRKIWPPANWTNPELGWWHAEKGNLDGGDYQLQGTFADLRDDKKFELVVLVNRANADHTQWLSAYELKDNAFIQMASVELPSTKIAFMINRVYPAYKLEGPHSPRLDTNPHVIFRAATARKCQMGGSLDGVETTELQYRFADGRLYPYTPYVGAK